MTSFAQRLVARGAGMPIAGGPVPLRPRPASRFEGQPAAGIAESLQPADALGTPTPAAPHDPATPVAADRPAMPRPPLAPPMAPMRREAPASAVFAESAPDQSSPTFSPALPRESPADTRPLPTTTIRETSAPIEAIDDSPSMPPRLEPAPVFEALPDRDELPRRPESQAEPPATPTFLRVELAGRFPPAQPLPFAAEPTPAEPPVTVTIGRIDVTYVRPEPRPAAAPPPVQRTRGFDAYARARRGEPR